MGEALPASRTTVITVCPTDPGNRMFSIARALEITAPPVELQLSGCNLTERDMINLARILETNTTIVELCISSNPITDIGAAALLRALQLNTTLKHMWIGDFHDLAHDNPLLVYVKQNLSWASPSYFDDEK